MPGSSCICIFFLSLPTLSPSLSRSLLPSLLPSLSPLLSSSIKTWSRDFGYFEIVYNLQAILQVINSAHRIDTTTLRPCPRLLTGQYYISIPNNQNAERGHLVLCWCDTEYYVEGVISYYARRRHLVL